MNDNWKRQRGHEIEAQSNSGATVERSTTVTISRRDSTRGKKRRLYASLDLQQLSEDQIRDLPIAHRYSA